MIMADEYDKLENKKIKQPKSTKKNTLNEINYTYNDYLQNKIQLRKYRIIHLKTIAKKLKLHITGNKNVLVRRIENYYLRTKLVIILQKWFRGNMVRKSIELRGPAIKNRNLCVNNNDGYTLEPIDEIPLERFYSYKDNKDFIYGFDVILLLISYKKKGKMINPFSREMISMKHVNDILKLEKIIKLYFPYILDNEENEILKNANRHQPHLSSNQHHQYHILNQNIVPNRHIRFIETTGIVDEITNMNEIDELRRKMIFIRTKPINQRTEELFIEIDLLGNYTNSYWFSGLTITQLIRFFDCLYDIWNFRAHLNLDTKRKICQLYDPFLNYRPNNINALSINDTCITVMENMIYCGIDIEYRKLGALHVLSALTVVSIPARISMNWLYEAIM